MATPVTMPQMGYDMTEGSIQNWLKKEGDKVNKGDAIAEIETDKATVEMEAFASGVIKKIIVQPGQLVPVGTVVAIIGEENEEVDFSKFGIDAGKIDSPSDVGAARKSAGEGGEALSPDTSISLNEVQNAATVEKRVADGKAAVDTQAKKSPNGPGTATFSRKPAAGSLINLAAPVPATSGPGGAAVSEEASSNAKAETSEAPAKTSSPAPQIQAAKPAQAQTAPQTQEGNRVKSSPLARKVAGELEVDVADVSGTGPGGRVVRADVQNYADNKPAASQTTSAAATTASQTPDILQPLSRMRQTIARRMTEAKQQIPHFYVTSEIDMTEALKLRQTINRNLEGSAKVSVNDMILKAVAKALQKYPALNNSYVDGKIRVNGRINIAVAVALDDGLITPVVFDVDQKSIGQVALESRSLAEKARAGSLRPEEFQGGTFTVSNLGMYDVTSFVAIVNPPQAAILAVGTSKSVVVLKSGSTDDNTAQFGVAQQMNVTISADHRVTDGAVTAQFLQELKRILQNPMLLLV